VAASRPSGSSTRYGLSRLLSLPDLSAVESAALLSVASRAISPFERAGSSSRRGTSSSRRPSSNQHFQDLSSTESRFSGNERARSSPRLL
jgi:hypothetical protein